MKIYNFPQSLCDYMVSELGFEPNLENEIEEEVYNKTEENRATGWIL